MRSSEAAEHFFVAVNQSQKKKKVQDDDRVRRLAQLLHFLSKKNMFRSCFFLPLVQQVPHKLTVHTTSARCWELKSLRLIPNVWAEREALLRTNPSGTRPATVRIRLGSPSPRRTTKNDSMNVGQVPCWTSGLGIWRPANAFPWRMGEVSAKPVPRSQTQESHCDKQSKAKEGLKPESATAINKVRPRSARCASGHGGLAT